MKHFMRLKIKPFSSIWNGEKTIELRLLDEKRRKIKAGDIIEFGLLDSEKTITVSVAKLHIFDSFEELYKQLPLTKCGYSEAELPTAGYSDMDIYYSKEEQSAYGVVGIEFIVIDKKENCNHAS